MDPLIDLDKFDGYGLCDIRLSTKYLDVNNQPVRIGVANVLRVSGTEDV